MSRWKPFWIGAVGIALALTIAGCPSADLTWMLRPKVPSVTAQPDWQPDSPAAALRLFEWCYNHRDVSVCDLFPADFQFSFSSVDSAGSDYRSTPWTRVDEIAYTTHLFVSGTRQAAPATNIRLVLDRDFVVEQDPRYYPDPWHRYVRTQVRLFIEMEDGHLLEISGAAGFFLVRGDSAVIPPELQSRGFVRDSTRWWIRLWADETIPSGYAPSSRGTAKTRHPEPPVLGPQAVTIKTWGAIKALYRQP